MMSQNQKSMAGNAVNLIDVAQYNNPRQNGYGCKQMYPQQCGLQCLNKVNTPNFGVQIVGTATKQTVHAANYQRQRSDISSLSPQTPRHCIGSKLTSQAITARTNLSSSQPGDRSPSFRVGSPTSVLQDRLTVHVDESNVFNSPPATPTCSFRVKSNLAFLAQNDNIQQLRQQLHSNYLSSQQSHLQVSNPDALNRRQQQCLSTGISGNTDSIGIQDPSLSMLSLGFNLHPPQGINASSQHDRPGTSKIAAKCTSTHPTSNLKQPALAPIVTDANHLQPVGNEHALQSETFTTGSTDITESLSAAVQEGLQEQSVQQEQQSINDLQEQQKQQRKQKQKQSFPDLWTQFLNPGGNFKYKTEICTAWSETQTCKFGDKCDFAHGVDELRNIDRHPKYKTEVCRTFAQEGYCQYGIRCRFIHKQEQDRCQDASEAPAPITPKPCDRISQDDKRLSIFQQLAAQGNSRINYVFNSFDSSFSSTSSSFPESVTSSNH